MFKHKKLQPRKKAFPTSYTLTLFDSSIVSMYGLPEAVIEPLNQCKAEASSQRDLASRIYQYLEGSIEYGDSKRVQGYANAKQVWQSKQGVCGEMSFLYVTAARFCGLKSSYVSVTQDYAGKDVVHACAAVWTPEMVLVDIAYHAFDVHHMQFSLRSDRDVLANYVAWSQNL